MKAKVYFWILTGVMLLTLGFITFAIYKQQFSWYFIVAEVLIIIVLTLLIIMYAKIIKPLQTIGNGMDLLREQDFSSRLGYVGQKDADKIVEIFNNMMARLKEERLHIREQNHFLDLLIKSSPMGLIVMNFDDTVSAINPYACTILGVDESDEPSTFARSPMMSILIKISEGDSMTVRTDDGNSFKCTCSYFLDRGFHRKFYLIEQMTNELLIAEKKAYGQVIRMISHEVNNSMAGVTSSLNTVQGILDSVGEKNTNSISRQDISDMHELLSISSERCMSLSHFISAFVNVVKIPEPQLQAISINDFVNNRLRFLESICSSMGKTIAFNVELSYNACTVAIDPILMEQAIVNIVKNAVEAISDSGEISISTTHSSSDVTLTISNNGQPIPNNVADNLFTPFFSTKANGQGIGLTIIREILIKHNCRFSLHSDQDGWTIFRIIFPFSSSFTPLNSNH